MTQKVLITGGAGLIGSHLVEAYLRSGYRVVVVDKKACPDFIDQNNVSYYCQDINEAGLDEIFDNERPDIVNHHAALINVASSLESPVDFTKTNVLGTIRLLELSKKYETKQFLFASSVAVYGDTQVLPIVENHPKKPTSFYGLDKLLAEYYIHLYSQHFITTVFRYGNVYGPRQTSSAEGGVVAIFCQALLDKKTPVIYGDGEQTRDFIYVKDVAAANVTASDKRVSGLMHISTGIKSTVNELHKELAQIAGEASKPEYKQERKGEIKDSVLDNTLARQSLGWEPKYSLRRGLEETWQYFAHTTDFDRNEV